MKTRKILLAAFISAGFAGAAQSAMLLGDAGHGEQLYNAKCAGCHVSQFGGDGSGVFTRKDHHITTIEGLTGKVNNCNAMTHAGLSDDDINDVIKYLDEAFYKFEE